MKKHILASMVAAIATLVLPFKTFASGGFSVSTSSLSMNVGETRTFAVSATNAAGRLNISSSNAGVASVSTGAVFLDMSSESVTVTGNSAGSATISVVATSNFATYDEEILAGQTYTIAINVTEKVQPQPEPTPEPEPEPEPEPTPTPEPQWQDNDSDDTPSVPSTQQDDGEEAQTEETASKNVDILEISVGDYKTELNEDNHYTVTIPHDISKVTVSAVLADEKSKVSGTGEKTLADGLNTVELTVTAEDGTTKTYILEIFREESCKECTSVNCNCEQKSSSIITIIIAIVEGVAIIALIIFLIIKKNKNKKNMNSIDNDATTIGVNDGTQSNQIKDSIDLITNIDDDPDRYPE